MYNTTARFFVVVVVVSSAKSFPGDRPKIIYHFFSPVVIFIDNNRRPYTQLEVT